MKEKRVERENRLLRGGAATKNCKFGTCATAQTGLAYKCTDAVSNMQ